MDYQNMMPVLGSMKLEDLQAIAAHIKTSSTVEIMKPARTSLVMMGARESVQMLPFYLGEVLISQCAVSVDGSIGYGFIMGEDLEKAYCLAVIDAAIAGSHRFSPEIDNIVSRQAAHIREGNLCEQALIAKTKVQFETMEETSDESCG